MNYLVNNLKQVLTAVVLLLGGLLGPAPVMAVINVQIQTDQGDIDIELFNEEAPLTVKNFLNYYCDGDYKGTFIHRSAPNFVVQMGGFIFEPNNGDFFGAGTSHIPTDPPVVNEPDPVNRSNIRGTIAMAKLGGNADSATSEWFVNLVDNSANLDNQNGGFTVFGRVTGNGMNTVDAIAALPRCEDIKPGTCGSFDTTPLVNFVLGDMVQPANLVKLDHNNDDADGDGICDVIEDGALNAGDGNNDNMPDRGQGHVASFTDNNGTYLSLVTDPALLFGSISVSGSEFLIFRPAINEMAGNNFSYGFIGFEISNAAPGASIQADLILPPGVSPVNYFKYGGTPGNPSPHWYEFGFDGETGAEFRGNTITLNYVDGKRGDSDLDGTNGVIVDPGAPALRAGIVGPSGSSGGCSLRSNVTASSQAGAWWLILLMGVVFAGWRSCRQ